MDSNGASAANTQIPAYNANCQHVVSLLRSVAHSVHQHTHAHVYVIILAPLVNEWHEFDDIYVHACVPMHSVELLEAEAMLIAAGLRLSD